MLFKGHDAKENAMSSGRYPDGNATVLREKLAKKHGLKPDQFIFGAGSNEIITFIAQLFLNADDESIYATPSFTWYDTAVKSTGAKAVTIPLKDYTHDLEAMKNALLIKPKLFGSVTQTTPQELLLHPNK